MVHHTASSIIIITQIYDIDKYRDSSTYRDLLIAGVFECDHVLCQVLDQGQEAPLGVEPVKRQ
jgi:hypothetical protein